MAQWELLWVVSGSWEVSFRVLVSVGDSVAEPHPSRYPPVHAMCAGPLLSYASDLNFGHHLLWTATFLSGLTAPVLTQPLSFTYTLVVDFPQLMPPLSNPSCHLSQM